MSAITALVILWFLKRCARVTAKEGKSAKTNVFVDEDFPVMVMKAFVTPSCTASGDVSLSFVTFSCWQGLSERSITNVMAGRAKKPVASSSPVLASKAVAPRKSTNSRRIGINSWWDNLSSMNADELRELYMLDYHVGSLAEYRAGFDNDKFYVPDPLTIRAWHL